MSQAKRLIRFLPTIIILVLCVPFLGIVVTEGSKILGLRSVPVFVAGTGSMYPSLFWSVSEGGPEDETKTLIPEYRTTPHLYYRFPGLSWRGRVYFKPTLGHGDLVAFKNTQTAAILTAEGKDPQIGFIKRIIAIPGDTIELRDGFVYRNGELLSEPYINTPRSSYGGTNLADCQKITIPQDQYFVMGDNRKVSSDSRYDLGLIHENDIAYYLPFELQDLYHSLYRDTSADPSLIGTPTLSSQEFLTLVNQARVKVGSPALSSSPLLSRSATRQGEQILRQAPLKLVDVTSSVGYQNVVLAEFSSHGTYTASELYANLLSQPTVFSQVVHSQYQDIGIGVVNREIDGCPRQVIVGHLGGYIPPVYDSAMRQSWLDLSVNLRQIIPSWKEAQSYPALDQNKLTLLLTILERRLALATEVVETIDKQQWFSPTLKQRIEQDSQDADLAESLIQQLNTP